VRFDGPQRSTGMVGDLLEAQLAEEAQGDRLSIWLVEPADRRPDPGCVLGPQGRDRRVRPARQVDARRRIHWVDPGHIAPALGAAERDPDGDPGEPGSERTVTTPGGQAPEGGHEGLLGSILGFMEIAKDAMAGSQDRRTFAFDQEPERVAIACQDSIDSGAFIADLGAGSWSGNR
jgi:hypothetical protein